MFNRVWVDLCGVSTKHKSNVSKGTDCVYHWKDDPGVWLLILQRLKINIC